MTKCYGRRDPKEGEPPDFYIGDEPIWVCLKCGGNGCPSDAIPSGYRLERYGRRWISNRMTGELYETDVDDDSDDGDPLYRLMPLSDEAGDTDD